MPLVEDSLAHSLDAYFEQSEQLKSRLWLAADGDRAAGLLLQQLPSQVTQDDTERLQQWEHACSLAATVRDEELLNCALKNYCTGCTTRIRCACSNPAP